MTQLEIATARAELEPEVLRAERLRHIVEQASTGGRRGVKWGNNGGEVRGGVGERRWVGFGFLHCCTFLPVKLLVIV